jgi:tetratricopeptide (TPR) repeat protein
VARASVARWRGRSDVAAELVYREAPRQLRLAPVGAETDAVRVKAALWAGLLAKDQGALEAALAHFDAIPAADDLDAARVAFQRGDVFMRLGHFDRAMRAMDEAVTLALRSDALVTEQTRYLARRGTVHRRRGDLDQAASDFEAAREVLLTASGDERQRRATSDDAERDFWLARVEDEAGLVLLASGRFDEAALCFERNQRSFRRYAEVRGVNATYRALRSTLRLALAYGCRAVGQPFRRPFAITAALDGQGPDLRQARLLIAEVLRRIHTDSAGWASGRWCATRCWPPTSSPPAAPRRSRMPRQPWNDRATPTSAPRHERTPPPPPSASRLGRRRGLTSRPATSSWPHRWPAPTARSVATSSCAHGSWPSTPQRPSSAATRPPQPQRLARGLEKAELGPYHGALLRQFGEAVEAGGLSTWSCCPELTTLLQLDGPLEPGPLRLADALPAHWARLVGAGSAPRRAPPAVQAAGPERS